MKENLTLVTLKCKTYVEQKSAYMKWKKQAIDWKKKFSIPILDYVNGAPPLASTGFINGEPSGVEAGKCPEVRASILPVSVDVPMTDCDSQPKTAAPETALSTQPHCPQLSPLLHWLRGPRAPLLVALWFPQTLPTPYVYSLLIAQFKLAICSPLGHWLVNLVQMLLLMWCSPVRQVT